MKNISLLFIAFLLSVSTFAQRTVQMRNLWVRPQVHVLFEGYVISFTIKDIDRALVLLAGTGNKTYGTSSGLDTSKNYSIELYPGYRMEYHNPLQSLIQKGVGAFLLTAGHAYIENKKQKKITAVVMDIQPLMEGMDETDVKFYDPGSGKLIFNGKLPADLYNKDLGIE